MTAYFVTRHPGARDWALRQGHEAEVLAHLDPARIEPGDVVMGTLPVHVAAKVCARGGRYLHLSMTVPEDLRGRELNADEMEQCGAKLEEYFVDRRKEITWQRDV